jgi:hypothetical protein
MYHLTPNMQKKIFTPEKDGDDTDSLKLGESARH